jgi:hypothetical protein
MKKNEEGKVIKTSIFMFLFLFYLRYVVFYNLKSKFVIKLILF